MGTVLAVIFLVVPILEIAVIVLVADYIGGLETVALLIAVSILGAALAKREGVGVWRRFQSAISRGEIPSAEITDGFLILFGAALLLTPGFLTDFLGLILLAPFTRPVVKRLVRRSVGRWVSRRSGRFREANGLFDDRRDVSVVASDSTPRPRRPEGGDQDAPGMPDSSAHS